MFIIECIACSNVVPAQVDIMRAEVSSLNHCAVPFLSRTAINLCWYSILLHTQIPLSSIFSDIFYCFNNWGYVCQQLFFSIVFLHVHNKEGVLLCCFAHFTFSAISRRVIYFIRGFLHRNVTTPLLLIIVIFRSRNVAVSNFLPFLETHTVYSRTNSS